MTTIFRTAAGCILSRCPSAVTGHRRSFPEDAWFRVTRINFDVLYLLVAAVRERNPPAADEAGEDEAAKDEQWNSRILHSAAITSRLLRQFGCFERSFNNHFEMDD